MKKRCKCGAEIEFITGPNGRAIPAQRVKSVYQLSVPPAVPEERLDHIATRVAGALFVNHFETCPNADEFSRGKPRA